MRVGRRYRMRIIGLPVEFPNARVSLTARPDSSLVNPPRDSLVEQWRPVAKDGHDMPEAARAPHLASQTVSMSETHDAEYTPRRSGWSECLNETPQNAIVPSTTAIQWLACAAAGLGVCCPLLTNCHSNVCRPAPVPHEWHTLPALPPFSFCSHSWSRGSGCPNRAVIYCPSDGIVMTVTSRFNPRSDIPVCPPVGANFYRGRQPCSPPRRSRTSLRHKLTPCAGRRRCVLLRCPTSESQRKKRGRRQTSLRRTVAW